LPVQAILNISMTLINKDIYIMYNTSLCVSFIPLSINYINNE